MAHQGMAELDGLECEAMPRLATRRQRVPGGSFGSDLADSSPGGPATALGPTGFLARVVNRPPEAGNSSPADTLCGEWGCWGPEHEAGGCSGLGAAEG